MKIKSFAIAASIMLIIAGIVTGFSLSSNPDDVKTISGAVTSVDHPIAKLSGDDGVVYTVYMGPYWFWKDNGYELKTNSTIQVKGEVKDTDLYPWEIVQDGKTMTFTDEKGVPKWSNGDCKYRDGSGRGKGYGRGNCGDCPRMKNK